MLEIERKFLLKNLPKVGKKIRMDVLEIQQFYFKNGESDLWQRVRRSYSRKKKKTSYFHTIKKRISNGVNDEKEKKISKAIFENYLKDCIKNFIDIKCIEKVRHLYKDGRLKWEIDDFSKFKLVVAEVELPRRRFNLKFPSFITDNLIMEVTQFNEFGNRTLAEKIDVNKTNFKF